MRIRAVVAAAGMVLVAQLASGCGTASPTPVATPKPTATPVFASDDEALAAAEKAYAAYQAMEDQISADGGKDPDRIRDFAARQALEDALSGYADYREQHLHTVGKVEIDNAALRSRGSSNDGLNAVRLKACLDVSAVDLINEAGESEISPDRIGRQTFDITFDDVNGRLLLSSRDKSETDSQCV